MRLILLGAPGAGKGTQSVFLSANFGLSHVASGDLFRDAQNKGAELGLIAKSYMEKGQLVPDSIVVKLILERLTASDCKEGFLLDGFPRSLEQAKALDKALSESGQAIDKAVHIKVSNDELVRRLSGRWICRQCQATYHTVSSPPQVVGKCDRCGGELYQRADDTVETVQNRLEVYFAQTIPLIDYYQRGERLVEVNGEGTIEEISKELVSVLRPQ